LILPVTFFLADAPPLPYPEAPEQSDRSTTKSERSRVRVLVVDDEQLIASTVAAILNIHGFEAEAAFSGEEALAIARRLDPDIVLSDVLMPRMTGVELGIQMRREFPNARIVLFSGQASTAELMRRAEEDGHRFELFAKPLHPEELIAKLRGVQA
jgi:DNA-binding response OmpR family regulator